MSEREYEAISALIDNEVDELELQRVLNSVENNAEMREIWQRFNYQQQIIKQQPVGGAHWDVSSRVMAELEREPEYSAKHSNAVVTPIKGLAIAASVALAVVFGVRFYQNTLVDEAAGNSEVAVVATAPKESSLPTVLASDHDVQDRVYSPDDPQAKERFDHYLLMHTERASRNVNQGMISFARTVSYEVE